MKGLAVVALATLLGAGSGALAADYQVRMVDFGADGRPMRFEPAFLQIAPGDTVTFVPADRGHNSESVLGMIPAGARTWKGEIDEPVAVTFTVPGLYGYESAPQVGVGMVGLIQVGSNIDNLGALQEASLPPRAAANMARLFAMTIRSAAR